MSDMTRELIGKCARVWTEEDENKLAMAEALVARLQEALDRAKSQFNDITRMSSTGSVCLRVACEGFHGIAAALSTTPETKADDAALEAEARRLQQFVIDALKTNRGCQIGAEILAALRKAAMRGEARRG